MASVIKKKVYKFWSFTTFNARDEAHFNQEFEGYEFEGMAGHGARIVIVGSRMEEVKEPEEIVEEPEEITPVGAFSEEVEEVETQ